MFKVGEKVVAFWRPEEKWYPATVLEKTKTGNIIKMGDNVQNLVQYNVVI